MKRYIYSDDSLNLPVRVVLDADASEILQTFETVDEAEIWVEDHLIETKDIRSIAPAYIFDGDNRVADYIPKFYIHVHKWQDGSGYREDVVDTIEYSDAYLPTFSAEEVIYDMWEEYNLKPDDAISIYVCYFDRDGQPTDIPYIQVDYEVFSEDMYEFLMGLREEWGY